MIISKNINPENNLYYIGALIIEVLEKQQVSVSVSKIFELFNINKKRVYSYNLFVLGLNWLFLLDLINWRRENIKLCL